MNIGFIGLGNMGAGMAHNLLMHCKDSGDTLIVLDINETVLAGFIAKGAINGMRLSVLHLSFIFHLFAMHSVMMPFFV